MWSCKTLTYTSKTATLIGHCIPSVISHCPYWKDTVVSTIVCSCVHYRYHDALIESNQKFCSWSPHLQVLTTVDLRGWHPFMELVLPNGTDLFQQENCHPHCKNGQLEERFKALTWNQNVLYFNPVEHQWYVLDIISIEIIFIIIIIAIHKYLNEQREISLNL